MERRPLYFTFGNHMHWVDMQWLWGYHVLPGSVGDMLRLVEGCGVRGNVNFDGIGYEKMAAECPEALADLRGAIADGKVAVVGGSYGQPYGLFQGGESNVRQLVHGVRSVMRTLKTRPRVFWEEEFYFLPQLPQLLLDAGYEGASLFFQWTWHTPEIPREPHALILWEGVDGSAIPTLPRNDLNVHQWPEDFDGLLEGPLITDRGGAGALGPPAIVQWLELMPHRDWMCRAELMAPRLKELAEDPRFELRPRTAETLITELREQIGDANLPRRRYSMDEVWHGVSLGKNGDLHPRQSRECEQRILFAEFLSTLAGHLGRPYPSWDVYPTWELDEAWRELLAAQHHDNHECEGLCGSVGRASFWRSRMLADEVVQRTISSIAGRIDGSEEDLVVFNPSGWERSGVVLHPGGGGLFFADEVPPFGCALARRATGLPSTEVTHEDEEITITSDDCAFTFDTSVGTIVGLEGRGGRQLVDRAYPLLGLEMTRSGERRSLSRVTPYMHPEFCNVDRSGSFILAWRGDAEGDWLELKIDAQAGGVGILIDPMMLPRPDPGMLAGLQMPFRPAFEVREIRSDTPYAVDRVDVQESFPRKYPSGDWMTSPQWFESVPRPFTSRSFVDLIGDGVGLLVLHDGSQQWMREDDGVRVLLTMYDPWDEERDTSGSRLRHIRFKLIPHSGLSDAQRLRYADEFERPLRGEAPHGGAGIALRQWSGPTILEPDHVLATAWYRVSEEAGRDLPLWVGRALPEATHPCVLRLVEVEGRGAEVVLRLPGTVVRAARTNLLGEVGDAAPAAHGTAWLEPKPVAKGADGQAWSEVRLSLAPREIATVVYDPVEARKEWRDLDAERHVWAKVHRKEGR